MKRRSEWIKCSIVAVLFYIVVFILLGYNFFGFTNFWFVFLMVALAVGDVLGLKWWITRQEEEKDDL